MEGLGLFNPIVWSTTESSEKPALLYHGKIFIEGEEDADGVEKRTFLMQEGYPDDRYAFIPRFSADPASTATIPPDACRLAGWA